MERRSFLGGLFGGVVTLTGYSAVDPSPGTDGSDPSIVDRRFRLVDPEQRFDAGSYDFDERFRHVAEIRFDAETNRVVVAGRLRSGGRSCKRTVLESATYDSTSDTLTLVVFDRVDESVGLCTSEIAVVPYEATVTFDTELPGEVVVEHRTEGDGTVFSTSEVLLQRQ